MEMRHVLLNTNDMSLEEVDTLIEKLKKIRARKGELQNRINSFQAMAYNMKKEGMTFVSKTTGEVLDPNDWKLYDEITHSFYHEDEEEDELE